MADELETCAAFVEGAPPGELADVVADIKSLTNPGIVDELGPAFEQYCEEQFITTRLPNGSKQVIISSYSKLPDGRYYDVESNSSFDFNHTTQKATSPQSYVLEGPQADLVKSTLKAVGTYTKEHYSSPAYGVYPIEGDSKIAIVIVANKYSPNNFWNGRWRSAYTFDPSSGTLEGSIKVDVHYYEDGNVRLLTEKTVVFSVAESGSGIIKDIASTEKKYQEELNRGFVSLSEGAFKGLRRQLPITRQKIEWDKVTSYRLGQDIGGGSLRR